MTTPPPTGHPRLPPPATGIWVFRASRLEALLDPLATLLASNPPDAVLAPQTVVVAHPGMRQWLLGALAQRSGQRGIAANLDIVLPSAWLERLSAQVLGPTAPAARAYRRETLRWRIHALLEPARLEHAAHDGLDDPRLRAFLDGADVPRRRFQLADRLARIYTQFLVYRPDWLDAWAAGRKAFDDAGFIAPLWRRLRRQIDAPHRGEILQRLAAAIERDGVPDADTPLHVFGVSHLAPSELAVLRAVARKRLVVFHVPDPCRESWGGMQGARSALRELAKARPDDLATESAFLDLGHPLLAQWGRIGQHFLLLLEDSEIAVDERHVADERDIVPASQLERLQESIRRGNPALAIAPVDAAAARNDRSLRIHACHTKLRELEVLRDALLRELAERPDLQPSDIVVMAPDIQAYAPLLPAVFGEAGRHRGALPYHLADVAIARSHPLFDAFAALLALPQSRLTAPEVADLLAVPQVAARFGLSGGDIETITGWLREVRVAWALDAAFRARFGVPAIDAQTFAWGMDRMLAGYAMGADDGDEPLVAMLPDGIAIAPLDGIGGPQAALLGALDGVLVELARWCEAGAQSRPASAWAAWLERRFDAIFRIDGLDADARGARDALLHAIRAIASEPAEAGQDPDLAFGVVRDLLLAALAAVPEQQRFLHGGVTFCGMVPQRAVPFRVVAVLGLDDGRFPRAIDDAGLDPMRTRRRIGDRDVRNDDRYLFLQTVMSARDALHLSFVGEGVRDAKPRNPAAPLGDLIALLDPSTQPLDTDGLDEDAARAAAIARRPWCVRHPLQPFDARYFDGSDPALFSYRPDFAALDPSLGMAVAERAGTATAGGAAPRAGVADGTVVTLPELLGYFHDPARHVLAQRMKLRLDALDDDRLRDSESLDARTEAIDRIARRVFMDALAHPQRRVPDEPPAALQLTGLLPPGRLGAAAWSVEADKVRALLKAHAAHPLLARGMPRGAAIALDLRCGPYRITGAPARAVAHDDAVWVFDVLPGKKESELHFGQRIGLFLEWAFLRLADPDGARPVRVFAAVTDTSQAWQGAINAWDADFVAAARARDAGATDAYRVDLVDRVRGLLDHWTQAQDGSLPYYPRTSWTSATLKNVGAAWMGSDYGAGERDFAPGYARVLAGDAEFAAGDAALDQLAEIALALRRWIHFGDDDAEDAA